MPVPEPENRASADSFFIEDLQVFENGYFNNDPAFLTRLKRSVSSPETGQHKFQKAVSAYEKNFTWHIVGGHGFCGANHPGASKVFHSIVSGSNIVYNDDCVYSNTKEKYSQFPMPPKRPCIQGICSAI